MSLNAIRENKNLAKIYEFTLYKSSMWGMVYFHIII